jgi:hypothetical protein
MTEDRLSGIFQHSPNVRLHRYLRTIPAMTPGIQTMSRERIELRQGMRPVGNPAWR